MYDELLILSEFFEPSSPEEVPYEGEWTDFSGEDVEPMVYDVWLLGSAEDDEDIVVDIVGSNSATTPVSDGALIVRIPTNDFAAPFFAHSQPVVAAYRYRAVRVHALTPHGQGEDPAEITKLYVYASVRAHEDK